MKQDVDSVMKFQKETTNDIYYMELALKEAKKAFDKGEVPVGALIVKDNKILAKAHNKKEQKNNTIYHAEIEAIIKASKKINNWMLDNATLYVTCEPCIMCAGAIMQARIKKIVYATNEPKFGAFGSILDINNYPFNHHIGVIKGIKADEASTLLKNFFKDKRQKN